MSICIRYAKDFNIYERFLGFLDVSSNQNADSLSTAIISFLKKINLNKIPIIAQSYDGASVMSGSRGGVQKKLKDYYPYATYIHCMAHKLNLVILDMCKNIKVSYYLFYLYFYCNLYLYSCI